MHSIFQPILTNRCVPGPMLALRPNRQRDCCNNSHKFPTLTAESQVVTGIPHRSYFSQHARRITVMCYTQKQTPTKDERNIHITLRFHIRKHGNLLLKENLVTFILQLRKPLVTEMSPYPDALTLFTPGIQGRVSHQRSSSP